jgi:hypothetical protein
MTGAEQHAYDDHRPQTSVPPTTRAIRAANSSRYAKSSPAGQQVIKYIPVIEMSNGDWV